MERFNVFNRTISVLADPSLLLISNGTNNTTIRSNGKVPFDSVSNVTNPIGPEDQLTSAEDRRQFIVNMTLESWNAYVKYAWGQANLKPLSISKQQGWLANAGTTIISAMSTLWVMGLREEFDLGRQWVQKDMDLDDRGLVKIGALLSCYALTSDLLFLNMAETFANLYNATEIEISATNVSKPKQYFHQMMVLREWINQRLEYRYLSDITGEPKYWDRIQRMETYFDQQPSRQDDPYQLENWSIKVKAYIQSRFKNKKDIEQYYAFLRALEEKGRLRTTKSKHYYIKESSTSNYMNNRYCYFGAMLTLGQYDKQNVTVFEAWGNETPDLGTIVKHLNMAKKITELCYASTKMTRSGLAPFKFMLNENANELNKSIRDVQGGFALNPDMAESYFILWRMTGDQRYREYAWQMALAIYKHCRTDRGYASVRESNANPTVKIDHQPAEFLSATLKYLYLTFSPNDVLPLNRWIFNADGHPLPIYTKGKEGQIKFD
ncbi:hypothetical protein RDWZM_004002 [Blomia tropicalis]|uniref:alpha-1,2-Mannosidase n=1 Tax=Blomia tropicalis TaxID=40697 RepID=A0A9Q0MGU9_BLOTA|nr:hypothetical protein RDWZM_004002 [Blomia tropicalis]